MCEGRGGGDGEVLCVRAEVLATFPSLSTPLTPLTPVPLTPQPPLPLPPPHLTLAATDMAATLLGCVHPIFPSLVYPVSCKYCGICVVLPDPVSATTINTWYSSMALSSSSLNLNMGRSRRWAWRRSRSSRMDWEGGGEG